MCVLGLGALATAAGGATAAGATAAATTAATTLQTIGAIGTVAGPLVQGISSYQAGKATADALEEQRATEGILTSIEDQRVREKFNSQIASQRSEIAARGFDLASPTAVFLGQTAAKEMAFASQSVRQKGAARQTELTEAAKASRARGIQALFKGGFGAAGELLTAAPDLWPELLA